MHVALNTSISTSLSNTPFNHHYTFVSLVKITKHDRGTVVYQGGGSRAHPPPPGQKSHQPFRVKFGKNIFALAVAARKFGPFLFCSSPYCSPRAHPPPPPSRIRPGFATACARNHFAPKCILSLQKSEGIAKRTSACF